MSETTANEHFNTATNEGAIAADAPPPGSPYFKPVRFNGQSGEFFGIWIVNLILTMVTMGIYDAWAKVRVKNYFYQNTVIGERDRLVYHATGGQIFIGRIIAFAVIVVISLINQFFPFMIPVTGLLILIAMPYLINRSLRFNARMTSWRNVRFDWHGTYWKTLLVFVIGPAISILSLGLLLPVMSRYYYQYYAKGHSFGITRFDASTRTGQFYAAFLRGFVLPIAIALIIVMGIAAFFIFSGSAYPFIPAEFSVGMTQILIFLVVIAISMLNTVYNAMCRNILLKSLSLGDAVDFNSSIRPWTWFGIVATNFLAILFSLGLAIPWTLIRAYRYLASNTYYRLHTDEHQFADQKSKEMSAFGQEFADMEGWEISI